MPSDLHFRWSACLVGLSLALVVAGCRPVVKPPAEVPPPKVKVVLPVTDTVQEADEFPGRTAAVEMIELRSRVTGYLDQVAFTDGADVVAGQLLFVIDPRTYQAEETRTKASIEQYRARVSRLERQQNRSQELFDKQAISRDEYEAIQFDRNEAQASLDAALAAHQLAKLNVEFTQIKAPLSGRISRRLVDPGNLVTANETPLATLIPLDRVYVYFDMDERTVLRLRRAAQESSPEKSPDTVAKTDPPSTAADGDKGAQPNPPASTAEPAKKPLPPVKVEIALADRDTFDLQGQVDFEDNQIDPSTGTLRVRATVENRDGLLSPGLFVRVRYPLGQPAPALLIPEEALGSDQGRPFVYVVGEGNKVAYRAVELGPLFSGKRVIRSGLAANERVVVTGLQRVRRNMQVIPE